MAIRRTAGRSLLVAAEPVPGFSGDGGPATAVRETRSNLILNEVTDPGLVPAVVTKIDNRTGDTKNVLLTPAGGVWGPGGNAIGF